MQPEDFWNNTVRRLCVSCRSRMPVASRYGERMLVVPSAGCCAGRVQDVLARTGRAQQHRPSFYIIRKNIIYSFRYLIRILNYLAAQWNSYIFFMKNDGDQGHSTEHQDKQYTYNTRRVIIRVTIYIKLINLWS